MGPKPLNLELGAPPPPPYCSRTHVNGQYGIYTYIHMYIINKSMYVYMNILVSLFYWFAYFLIYIIYMHIVSRHLVHLFPSSGLSTSLSGA